MEEFAAKPIENELFQIEANIPEDISVQLEKIVPRATSGEITAPFRAKSYISIGEPLVFPLTQLGGYISTEIRMQMSHYEFCRAHLTCSFDPANNCRFFDARFELALTTLPVTSNFPINPNEDAIAYDLYPQRIEDERKFSRKYNLGSDLKFNFRVVSANFPASEEKSEEYIIYNNQVTASGLRTSKPAWHFSRTEAHEISGVQELFLLIRKPKNSQVRATLSLAAQLEVMTKMGPFGPFPLAFSRRGSTDPLIADQPVVPLC